MHKPAQSSTNFSIVRHSRALVSVGVPATYGRLRLGNLVPIGAESADPKTRIKDDARNLFTSERNLSKSQGLQHCRHSSKRSLFVSSPIQTLWATRKPVPGGLFPQEAGIQMPRTANYRHRRCHPKPPFRRKPESGVLAPCRHHLLRHHLKALDSGLKARPRSVLAGDSRNGGPGCCVSELANPRNCMTDRRIKKSSKWLAVLCGLAVCLLVKAAYGEDEVYYCAEIASTGFYYDEGKKEYATTLFTPRKFKMKLERGDVSPNLVIDEGNGKVKKMESCIYFSVHGLSDVIVSCRFKTSLRSINFNLNNKKFTRSAESGYVDAESTQGASILGTSYGTCSKF